MGEKEMFVYRRKIFMKETDATGRLYFADQISLAAEAFQAFLFEQGGKAIDLPLVHVEADFGAPLKWGDTVKIALSVKKLGTTSFHLEAVLFREGGNLPVGKVVSVHVAVDPSTRGAMALPSSLLDQLGRL